MAEQNAPGQAHATQVGEALRQLTQVLRQLGEVLRQQGEQKPRSIWDRPIVITLIGTVAISLFSLLWQSREHRNAAELEYQRRLLTEKHALLRTFSAAIHKSGNAMNRWLQFTLFIGEEKDKPAGQQNKRNIAGWSKLAIAAQADHSAADPLEGILMQVQATFQSPAVREHAKKLAGKVAELEQLISDTNQTFNVREALDAAQVRKLSQKRRAVLNEIAALRDEVIQSMGSELADGAQQKAARLFCIASYCV